MILVKGDDYFWCAENPQDSCYITLHKINEDGSCVVSSSGDFFTVDSCDLSYSEEEAE